MPNVKNMVITFMINAKINHKFSDRSRIYLSVYNGKDHFAAIMMEIRLQGWKHNELGKYHCFRQMELYIQQPSVQQHTVSYNNYLFDVTHTTNNKYANSMGASI